jgi:hypothetical protein
MGAVAFHALWAAEEASKHLLQRSCCPALMALLTGPFFQGKNLNAQERNLFIYPVYGTVFTGNLHCDPLSTCISIICPSSRCNNDDVNLKMLCSTETVMQGNPTYASPVSRS